MKFSLFIISFFISIVCSAQKSFDTANVILYAKLAMLSYANARVSQEDIIVFMKDEINYRFLNSNGFNFMDTADRVLFIELNQESDFLGEKIADTINGLSVIKRTIIKPVSVGSYIIAYDIVANKIYKIKGYRENDLFSFFHFVKQLDCEYNYVYSEKYQKNRIASKRYWKYFDENFWVENLNLKCLHRGAEAQLKMYRKSYSKIKRYNSCLQPSQYIIITAW